MIRSDIHVERVGEYSLEVAAGIGALMPDLSQRLSGEPVSRAALEAIIASPDREQFIARHVGTVVGAATLNTILSLNGNLAYLSDFVVSENPEYRGKGIGFAIWREMDAWCQEHQLGEMEFTSNGGRQEAHKFYQRQGAVIKPTSPFIYHIPEAPDA